jgi:flagellin-specific chaperone FliS
MRQAFGSNARAQYHAIINPSSLATEEQIEYCHRAREEMAKWRAMYDAGWKTPAEEGYDAFDPKIRPVDWDGSANPYPSGTTDHDEWADGYSDAITKANAELADAYEALEDDLQAEEERRIRESSLDSFFAHAESLANNRDNRFQALADINLQMGILGGLLLTLALEIARYLPDDLRELLNDLINRLGQEAYNREVERIGSVDGRLTDFRQLIIEIKSLGAEIAARGISSPYGVIDADLLHFWYVLQDKQYRGSKTAGDRVPQKRRSRG